MHDDTDPEVTETLETAHVDAMRKKQSEQWLSDNCEAISAYNARVEALGVFSDNVRSF